MQEEVENRTLNLAISTTKLSGRALLAAFRKYMQHRRNVKAKKLAAENEKPVGEQTIDQLLGQNQGATNIEIEKTDIKGFKRFLDKYGIDYAITKDPSQTPPRYLVFFKARDGDAMTAAFKEYSASLLQKQKKPSVLKQLNKLKQSNAAICFPVCACIFSYVFVGENMTIPYTQRSWVRYPCFFHVSYNQTGAQAAGWHLV